MQTLHELAGKSPKERLKKLREKGIFLGDEEGETAGKRNVQIMSKKPGNCNTDFFDDFKLKPGDLDEEVDYLVDDFLPEGAIVMIFAKASQGKSYFVLFLALKLLEEGRIAKCVYFDMDNPRRVLKQRGLDKHLKRHPELFYIHRSKLKDINHLEILDHMVKEAKEDRNHFKGHLVVIDSIRDFLGGRDMNKDKDIIPLIDKLKMIRDAGATIIFLHHSKKTSKENEYKGATTFIDSIDVAYALLKKDIDRHKKVAYALQVVKDRIAVDNTGFELDTETGELVLSNYELVMMDEKTSKLVADIQTILSKEESIIQSHLLEAIGKSAKDRKAIEVLKRFAGIFWQRKETGTYPKTVSYTLL